MTPSTAPAKLNLSLHITGRRADGYHELESLVVFLNPGDRLSISASDTLSLTINGEFAPLLQDDVEQNLVLQAARLLQERYAITHGAHISLEKNIPPGAGLGGGSADAAATLRLLNNYWALNLSHDTLRTLAASLGSDIPACIDSAPVIMRGTGTELTPATLDAEEATQAYVVVWPGKPLATKDVYRAYANAHALQTTPLLTSPPLAELNLIPPPLAGGARGGCPSSTQYPEEDRHPPPNLPPQAGGGVNSHNHLTSAAVSLMPEIGDMLATLAALPGCMDARMSGSGSACFGIFPTLQEAKTASRQLRQTRPGWWIRTATLYTP